jgi:predicted transcriptional regulator
MRVPRGREEKKMTDQEANSEIFNKLIANENRADLLMLFRRNPGLIDAVDGIARRIGLQPSGISDDLSELVKIGCSTSANWEASRSSDTTRARTRNCKMSSGISFEP